jgi:hypothetical protein
MMMEERTNITNDLKRGSASMGVVFFGLRYGKTVTDLDVFVDRGIAVCDTIIKGRALPQSDFPRYEDRAVRDAFVRVASHRVSIPEQLPEEEQEMLHKAQLARRTLKQLKDRENISQDDMDASAEFFRKICNAI